MARGRRVGRRDGEGEEGGEDSAPLGTSALCPLLAVCPCRSVDPPEDLRIALGCSHVQGSGP